MNLAPTALPFPLAALLRRARNAKSPRDRHDTAFTAWEAAVHLAVAARPPRDVAALARATLGVWVSALDVGDAATEDAAVRAVFALLTTRDPAAPPPARRVRARELLDALPEYRNKLIGHGAPTQAAEFYDAGFEILVAGLEPFWRTGAFGDPAERLVVVDAVEVDAMGARRARVIDLSGDAPTVVSPRGGMDVPSDLLPQRLYLRKGDTWRSVHPWLLRRERDGREEVFFFAKLGRRAEYLDFQGGTWLKGNEVEEVVSGTEAELRRLFADAHAPAAAEPAAAADPHRFGDFELLGRLGGGGMGVVHLARQRSLDRVVALKRMLLPERPEDARKAAARFRQEMEALALCDHPHVVKILASGEEEGRLWYAMEYVEGADLAAVAGELASSSGLAEAVSSASQKLRAERKETFERLPVVPRAKPALSPRRRDQVQELAEAMRDAALGLGHLHEAGVLHRDVKPGNLMLTPDRRVVVMDLGLARMKDVSGSLSRDQKSVLGTLRYMPPEQLNRRLVPVDERSDVYGLGATFYELFTGHALFEAEDDEELITKVLRDEPLAPKKVNPRLPSDLATIVVKCIAKDPRERYASMPAVARDLTAYLEGRPISARPPSFGYYAKLAVRRNPAVAAVSTLAAVAVFVVAAVAYTTVVDERDRSEHRLADSLVAEGHALASHGRWGEARQRFTDGLRLLEAQGRDELAGRLGLWRTLCASPDPLCLVATDAAASEHIVVTADGRELIHVEDGRTVVRSRFDIEPHRTVLAESPAPVRALAASPDASIVVAGLSDGSAWRIAAPSGASALAATAESEVTAIATNAIGDVVAGTAAGDVIVWRHEHSGAPTRIGRSSMPVRCVAVSRDGSRCAWGDVEHVRAADLGRPAEVLTLGRHKREVLCVALSPDGLSVASGGADAKAQICAFPEQPGAARPPPLTLRGHESFVTAIDFTPEGDRVVTASADRTLRVWTAAAGESLMVLPIGSGGASAVAVSDRLVAAADSDGILRVWSMEPRVRTIRPHIDRVQTIAVSPDGTLAASGSWDGHVKVFDIATGTLLHDLFGHTSEVRRLAFSPTQHVLASGGGDGLTLIWDLATGEIRTSVGAHMTNYDKPSTVHALAFTRDGNEIAIGDFLGVVRIFDLRTQSVTRQWTAHGSYVMDLTFLDSAGRLLTGGADGLVRIWEANSTSESEPHLPRVHDGIVVSIDASPDSSVCASTSRDGTIALWDAGSGTFLRRVAVGRDTSVALAIHPAGRTVLSAGPSGTLRLWRVSDGEDVASFEEHSAIVWSARWTPDGRRMVSGGWDGRVAFWDLSSAFDGATHADSRAPWDVAARTDPPIEAARRWAARGSSEWAADALRGWPGGGASPRSADLEDAVTILGRAGRREEAATLLAACDPESMSFRLRLMRTALKAAPAAAAEPIHARPYFGLATMGDDAPDDADGLEIIDVTQGSPAAAAGLQRGDRLVSVGDLDSRTRAGFYRALTTLSAGQTARLVYRRGGETRTTFVDFRYDNR